MATLTALGNATSAQPTGDQLLGVNPRSKTYGDDVSAALSLADWDKYKSLYQPLEDMLIGQISDPQGRQRAMDTAAQGVGQSADNAQEAFGRQARGLGLQLKPDQQATYERKSDISAGLSRVGAANTAARNYDQLRRIILGGQ